MDDLINKSLSYDQYFLNSNFPIWKYEEIKRDQREIFVVLRELDLTSAAAADRAACTAAIVVASGCCAVEATRDAYYKIYNQVKKEFETTGKIKGFEVYCVNLNIRVWISCCDWEILKGK
jgi:hypothetical protein